MTLPTQNPLCSAPQSGSHGGRNRRCPLKLPADNRKLASEQGQARADDKQPRTREHQHQRTHRKQNRRCYDHHRTAQSSSQPEVYIWQIVLFGGGCCAHPSRSLPITRPSTSRACHFRVLPSGCRMRVTAQLLKQMLRQVPNRDLKGGPFRLALELKSIVVRWCTLMNTTRCLQ